jgi:hypothetical protein
MAAMPEDERCAFLRRHSHMRPGEVVSCPAREEDGMTALVATGR